MNRRTLITGLVSLVAAPAIVRCTSLMQVRGIVMPPVQPVYWMGAGGFFVDAGDGVLRNLAEQWAAIPTPEFQMVGPEAFQLIREFGN